MELRLKGLYHCDKTFKAGYLQRLEDMLIEKLPSHGIKGVPHIQSRIKTPKNNWQAIFDLVYGPNTSEFGWDSVTKYVIAEPAV